MGYRGEVCIYISFILGQTCELFPYTQMGSWENRSVHVSSPIKFVFRLFIEQKFVHFMASRVAEEVV